MKSINRDALGRVQRGSASLNPNGAPILRKFINARDAKLFYVHGIRLSEYTKMLEDQDGRCAICGMPETMTKNGKKHSLQVDHDHSTGKIRGLLCYRCNTGIGKLYDNPDILRAAAEYIEKNK